MRENARMIKLFTDLYDGDPWLGVNWMDTLKTISAEKACTRIAEDRNTIWEIVNHVTLWRRNVWRRIQGEVNTTPDHNYILPVTDVSEEAWQRSLQELKDTQQQWLDLLESYDENQYSNIYPNNQMTYYEHIHGILQHDAYHLGQIVLLSKLMEDTYRRAGA